MELYYPGKVETVFRTARWSLGYFTFDMINGSPCSSPPFSVKPQGAPPCNSAWTSTNVPLWITELLPPGTLLSIARMWGKLLFSQRKKEEKHRHEDVSSRSNQRTSKLETRDGSFPRFVWNRGEKVTIRFEFRAPSCTSYLSDGWNSDLSTLKSLQAQISRQIGFRVPLLRPMVSLL